MREGGAILSAVLRILAQSVKPGMTTLDLADIADSELKRLGGKPAFLGYHGFPSSLCVSVNDEVVHGIPSAKRTINDGDLVSMDFGVLHKGLITDAAITVIAGEAKSNQDKLLVEKTRQSLAAAVDVITDGVKVGTIGSSVENILKQANFGIVRDFVGHGVGDQLHEDPNIPNFGVNGQGKQLHAGMTIAVEPMATAGDEAVQIDPDGWTVRTRDGSRSAHFEQTILVTVDGAEVLTPHDFLD